MSTLFRTPLTEWHVAQGARMGPFAGWDMPIQYEGILAEHAWTRSEASAFDTCHMGEFELRGATAAADLERLLTQAVSTLKTGQCRYGFLCNETGGVIDDLTCYKVADEHYVLVVNAGTREADAAHIRAHLSENTVFEDRSPGRAKIDIQGPRSRERIDAALLAAGMSAGQVPDLKYFHAVDYELAGIPMRVSRTGYTGEWGYEFYLAADRAVEFWELLLVPGDIRPAGLGARDTLRLEMGYPLYGHELNAETSPWAATGGMFIQGEKDFVGRKAMDMSPTRRLVALKLEGRRAAREGSVVVTGEGLDQEVGLVTSGAPSPSLGVAIALAYVDSDVSENAPLACVVRGKALAAERVSLPFYKEATARAKPKE